MVFFASDTNTFTDMENIVNFKDVEKALVLPKAFTEKGLYMLATILKSPKATQTTIAIIETFAKIKELTRTVNRISESDDEQEQKGLIRHGGDILSDLLYQEVPVSDTETSIELNFAVLKLKHTIKRKK